MRPQRASPRRQDPAISETSGGRLSAGGGEFASRCQEEPDASLPSRRVRNCYGVDSWSRANGQAGFERANVPTNGAIRTNPPGEVIGVSHKQPSGRSRPHSPLRTTASTPLNISAVSARLTLRPLSRSGLKTGLNRTHAFSHPGEPFRVHRPLSFGNCAAFLSFRL